MPQHILDLKNQKTEPRAVPSMPPTSNEPIREPQSLPKTSALLEWETDEYEHRPKNRNWFFALGGVTTVVAGLAVYLANYFFAAFIIVAGFMIGWFAKKEPKKVTFAVTSEGVQLDRRLYLFDDLKSFWIFYDPPLFKELTLESKKTFMPRLTVPLGNTSPERIRETLRKFLNEEKQQESMLSLISKLVGF